MIEVSLRRVFEDALRDIDTERRRFSKNGSGMEPLEGYELAFEIAEIKGQLLREHMRDIQAGKPLTNTTKRVPAPWQREIMNGDGIDKETGEITGQMSIGDPA